MVPTFEEPVLVVAVFRREDLVRLHALLVCYESPFTTGGETVARVGDVRSHEVLRGYVARLLDS